MTVVGNHFRPEFINRIDETVVFHPLMQSQIHSIARIQMTHLNARLQELGMSLTLSEQALTRISEVGYDPVYGARPLKRAIQNWLENPLANELLAGSFIAGDRILADLEGTDIVFIKQ